MTGAMARIENGFAEVGAGSWLASRSQPAAFFGEATRLRRGGWRVADRPVLDLVETSGNAKFADATRPFLTHIPCAAPITAVSAKVLLAPAAARTGAELVKPIPMSIRSAMCVTRFGQPEDGGGPKTGESAPAAQPSNAFVIMATASRTARFAVADGETLSVRPEAVVAWTGNRPTGFVRRLGVLDILLPRGPRSLVLHFHGPCIVWLEGANGSAAQRPNAPMAQRRIYGI